MRIKAKLTINFTILVAGILAVSSISVYLFTKANRQDDFLKRLRNKALNTSTLLINVHDVDAKLLKNIELHQTSDILDLKVFVLDTTKTILYSNTDSIDSKAILSEFDYMRWQDNNTRQKGKKLYLCLIHHYKSKKYYVLASAVDYFGSAELANLKIILFNVLIFSLLLTIAAGWFNARQSLRPMKDIIKQVDTFEASHLNIRLNTENNDEIGDLAKTFNRLLDRIEKAFETERTFVSNASHELRTPITSIKGQLEVGLLKTKTEAEYKALLSSTLDDVRNMATIVNGFLELAETNVDPTAVKLIPIRFDELVFSAKDDFTKTHTDCAIAVEFDKIPDDESCITVMGNERLIKILIINLLDNACKFSENKRAAVKISYSEQNTILKISDNGIGIPSEDIERIFEPLYRAKNLTGQNGYGIGLSIVKKVVDIHKGEVAINSEVNIGTTITVSIPNTESYS